MYHPGGISPITRSNFSPVIKTSVPGAPLVGEMLSITGVTSIEYSNASSNWAEAPVSSWTWTSSKPAVFLEPVTHLICDHVTCGTQIKRKCSRKFPGAKFEKTICKTSLCKSKWFWFFMKLWVTKRPIWKKMSVHSYISSNCSLRYQCFRWDISHFSTNILESFIL